MDKTLEQVEEPTPTKTSKYKRVCQILNAVICENCED